MRPTDSALMWFRRDLRLADNATLTAAVESGLPVAAAFVVPEQVPHLPGAASRAWLGRSLASLDGSLRDRGGRGLMVMPGPAEKALASLADTLSTRVVYCSRDWTPDSLAEEERVARALGEQGITLRVYEGQLLVPPDDMARPGGGPYRVFTPFHRAWLGRWHPESPLPAPPSISPAAAQASPTPPRMSERLASTLSAQPEGLDLERWWKPGEEAAQRRLEVFSAGGLVDYHEQRDFPGVDGTSRLSPRLAWGELSPRQVAHAALETDESGAAPFLRQLAWREFAYHVLHHFPDFAEKPLDARFAEFPWREDPGGLEAWKAGRTGYPLVDAGMRQLSTTGWMHNRVRMLCASFLAKDLLIPWQVGEEHFRERLVDYDPALNAFNWQWVAGSGLDAAPYFRILSPSRQAERFDAAGDYVREWMPEAEGDYAEPIVDHAEARRRALAAFSALRERRGGTARSG